MKDQICPKCGSTEIVPFIGIRDYDASSYRPISISVNLPQGGEKLNYRGSESRDVSARTCEACGYTEFYVLHPKESLSVYPAVY